MHPGKIWWRSGLISIKFQCRKVRYTFAISEPLAEGTIRNRWLRHPDRLLRIENFTLLVVELPIEQKYGARVASATKPRALRLMHINLMAGNPRRINTSPRVHGSPSPMGIESFDAAAVKRQFPGLVDPQLHYLDSAATAQMPEAVLHALRRFEIGAPTNVRRGNASTSTGGDRCLS